MLAIYQMCMDKYISKDMSMLEMQNETWIYISAINIAYMRARKIIPKQNTLVKQNMQNQISSKCK